MVTKAGAQSQKDLTIAGFELDPPEFAIGQLLIDQLNGLEIDAEVFSSSINSYFKTRSCLPPSHDEEQLRPPIKILAHP